MSQASLLIRTGVHPSAIITGYELALEKVKELLEGSITLDLDKLEEEEKNRCLLIALESSLSSKIPQYYKHFAKVVMEGCQSITHEGRFEEDSFRICKVLGSNVEESTVLKGFVINRSPESYGIERVDNAVVACYRCPLLLNSGETKGTIMVKNAEELL